LYPFKLFFIIFFFFLCILFSFLRTSLYSSLAALVNRLCYHTSVFPILLFRNLCTFLVKPSIPIISTQSSYFLICCFPYDIFTLCPLSAIYFFFIYLIAEFHYSIHIVFF
jgi:hypothetical protein